MSSSSSNQSSGFYLAPIPRLLDGTAPLDPNALADLALERAHLGAIWLASTIQPDGSFPYFYYPEQNQYDASKYNEVRHAGATYALFQACSLFDDPAIRAAAERATEYIVNASVSVPIGGAAYLYGSLTKLGGQGLALVALLERRCATGQTDLDDIIDALATFVLQMELPDDPGRYHQSYEATTQERRLTPNSHYYPGEALLATTRLAHHFPDRGWLDVSTRAANYLLYRKDGDIIAAGRVPREDHWLTMALADLYRLHPDPAYATVAFMQADAMIRNQIPATDPYPWRIGGSFRAPEINFTSTATKAEAMNTAWDLALFIGDEPAAARISTGALRTIQFLMRVQYTTENTSHFRVPERVVGAWAQDAAESRIRLDFVQHNISALMGSYTLLEGLPRTIVPTDLDADSTPTGPLPPLEPFTPSDLTQFSGPNVWFQQPTTRFRVALPDSPLSSAMLDTIRADVASAHATLPDELREVSLVETVLSTATADEPLPDLLGQLLIDLQRLTGHDVTARTALPGSDAVWDIAVSHSDPAAAREAVPVALMLLSTASKGQAADRSQLAAFMTAAATPRAAAERNITASAIEAAARRRGIPVLPPLPPPNRLREYGNGAYRQRFMRLASSKTSSIAAKLAGNKSVTAQILREAGLPTTECAVVRTVEEAIMAADRLGYPVVLKPVGGNLGRGVCMNLLDESWIRDAWPRTAAVTRNGPALVEKQVEGEKYRVLVIDGKVVSVEHSNPPSVIGDGQQTVRELIETENALRRTGRSAAQTTTEISVNDRLHDTLRAQGLDLESVLPEGRMVQIKPTGLSNEGAGGAEEVDRIHPDNAEICVQAAATIGLDIAGIDIVTPDIGSPMQFDGGAILEVNSGSGLSVHVMHGPKPPNDVATAIITMLFPLDKPVRVPVIAVMRSSKSVQIAEAIAAHLTSTGITVGLATSAGLVIDEMLFRGVDSEGIAGVTTLFDNPATQVAIVEVDPERLISEGLGFDYCDIAIMPVLSGLTTPAGKPVETVLLDLVSDSKGDLIANLDDPDIALLLSGSDQTDSSMPSLDDLPAAVGSLLAARRPGRPRTAEHD